MDSGEEIIALNEETRISLPEGNQVIPLNEETQIALLRDLSGNEHALAISGNSETQIALPTDANQEALAQSEVVVAGGNYHGAVIGPQNNKKVLKASANDYKYAKITNINYNYGGGTGNDERSTSSSEASKRRTIEPSSIKEASVERSNTEGSPLPQEQDFSELPGHLTSRLLLPDEETNPKQAFFESPTSEDDQPTTLHQLDLEQEESFAEKSDASESRSSLVEAWSTISEESNNSLDEESSRHEESESAGAPYPGSPEEDEEDYNKVRNAGLAQSIKPDLLKKLESLGLNPANLFKWKLAVEYRGKRVVSTTREQMDGGHRIYHDPQWPRQRNKDKVTVNGIVVEFGSIEGLSLPLAVPNTSTALLLDDFWPGIGIWLEVSTLELHAMRYIEEPVQYSSTFQTSGIALDYKEKTPILSLKKCMEWYEGAKQSGRLLTAPPSVTFTIRKRISFTEIEIQISPCIFGDLEFGMKSE